MTVHVMIDLETLGEGNYACIISLGAVKFDPQGDSILDRFYVAIEPESCVKRGLRMDADTILWWLHPDRAAARNALLADERHDLQSALAGFSDWFGPGSLPVWGNGATFDNVILRNAYSVIDLDCPWSFWDDRCFRTLKNLAPAVFPPVNPVVAHHALDDAIFQALCTQNIVKALGLTL